MPTLQIPHTEVITRLILQAHRRNINHNIEKQKSLKTENLQGLLLFISRTLADKLESGMQAQLTRDVITSHGAVFKFLISSMARRANAGPISLAA